MKVSVIVAVYNGGKTIKETLDSILAQTYEDIEVLVVDDASTDASAKVIKSIKDSRLKFIELKKGSGGPAHPRNIGLKQATGALIAICDQDDTWDKDKLTKQVTVYKNSKHQNEIGIIYCSSNLINEKGNVIDQNVASDGFIGQEESQKRMLEGDFITACSAVFPKKVAQEVGGFNEQLVGNDDYELWLKITQKYGILGIREVLCSWRSSAGSLSADKSHYEKNEKVFEALEKNSNQKEILFGHGKNLIRLFTLNVLSKKYIEAEEVLKKAKKYPRTLKSKFVYLLFRISPKVCRGFLVFLEKLGFVNI